MLMNLRVLWPRLLSPLIGFAICAGACVTEPDLYEVESWATVKHVSKPKDVPSPVRPPPEPEPPAAERHSEEPPPVAAHACELEDEQQVLESRRLLRDQAAGLTVHGDASALEIWGRGRYKQYPPALAGQLSETLTVMSQPEERLGPYGIGFLGMRGRRPTMEDRIVVHESKNTQVIALLDGHGGEDVVNAAADILPVTIVDYVDALSPKQRAHAGCVSDAIRRAFDGDHGPQPSVAHRLAQIPQRGSGATALVAVLIGEDVYVANLGRSVAFATVGHRTRRVTLDHSALLEADDIQRRGGYVEFRDGASRLNGILTVSRALGDEELPVGRIPDVVRIDGPVQRLVLASQGVVHSMGSYYTDTIAAGSGQQLSPGLNAEYLISFAYAVGSRNNLSAVILQR